MARKRTIVEIAIVLLAGTLIAGLVHWRYAHLSRPEAEPEPAVNLPVQKQWSKPVEVDGLEFQIAASPIWPAPGPIAGAESPFGWSQIRFELRITNRGKIPVRLLEMTGRPLLKLAGGKEFPLINGGSAWSDCGPKTIVVEPGGWINARGHLTLYVGSSKGISVDWLDPICDFWGTHDLKPSNYLLSLHYSAGNAKEWAASRGAWMGDVKTAEIPIAIADMRLSAPVIVHREEEFPDDLGRKNPLKIVGLSESIWKVPAAGKATRISLGYRLGLVEKSGQRIVPRLVSVHLRSADGVELPVRKTGIAVPVDEPAMIDMQPNINQSSAFAATLFREGQSLTLAWADGNGNVWNIDDLRPGRYSVRLVLRGARGAPGFQNSYWIGELRTADMEIEIRD
jgi:hypothetical protein